MALILELADAHVDEARDGLEALELARSHAPDLVLLDLQMPGGPGLTALPHLRALSPSSVLVVLTSHPTEFHRRLCIARGADLFLDKAADFVSVIRALLGRTDAGR